MFVHLKTFDWQFATIETIILLFVIESIESLFLLFICDYKLLELIHVVSFEFQLKNSNCN